ncbi:MAG: hypothetical protein ACTS5F_01985 [Candidatus Hodgkinia cicadicola]
MLSWGRGWWFGSLLFVVCSEEQLAQGCLVKWAEDFSKRNATLAHWFTRWSLLWNESLPTV